VTHWGTGLVSSVALRQAPHYEGIDLGGQTTDPYHLAPAARSRSDHTASRRLGHGDQQGRPSMNRPCSADGSPAASLRCTRRNTAAATWMTSSSLGAGTGRKTGFRPWSMVGTLHPNPRSRSRQRRSVVPADERGPHSCHGPDRTRRRRIGLQLRQARARRLLRATRTRQRPRRHRGSVRIAESAGRRSCAAGRARLLHD
jgi:hypothetical protein